MTEREKFEAYYSDYAQFPRATEKDREGVYIYSRTSDAWIVWQACAESKQEEIKQAEIIQAYINGGIDAVNLYGH